MRIKELRIEKGLTQAQLAQTIGVAQNTLSNWENGNRQPDKDNLLKMADLFGVSVDYLLGRDAGPAAPPKSREFEILPYLPETGALRPLVGSVRAGWDGSILAEYEGEMLVTGVKNPEEYVWMRVKGDSMEPRMYEGDYVLVHLQNTAESGDIIVAILNGEEGTIKIFRKEEKGVLLSPLNQKYPYVYIPADKMDVFYIYGVAVRVSAILK